MHKSSKLVTVAIIFFLLACAVVALGYLGSVSADIVQDTPAISKTAVFVELPTPITSASPQ